MSLPRCLICQNYMTPTGGPHTVPTYHCFECDKRLPTKSWLENLCDRVRDFFEDSGDTSFGG